MEDNTSYFYDINENIRVVYFNNQGTDWTGNQKGWDLVFKDISLSSKKSLSVYKIELLKKMICLIPVRQWRKKIRHKIRLKLEALNEKN